MKEYGGGANASKNMSAEVEGSSFLENLKLIGTVVIGSIALTYLFSKYEDTVKSFVRRIAGLKDMKAKNKLLLKKKNRRSMRRNHHEDASFEMSSELSTRDRAKRNRSRDIFYITEEDSDEEEEESSLCDDLIFPVCTNDSTISFSERRKGGKLYLNSNDELVSICDQNDELPETWNHVATKNERIIERIYRDRENEAAKFVEAIDNAVHQFKIQKVVNYEKNHGIQRDEKLYQSKGIKYNKDEKQNNKNCREISPIMKASTLKDLYEADIQQIYPTIKNPKVKNVDEKSVRLDRVDDKINKQTGSKTSSATASESEFVVRKRNKPKIIYPSINDFRNKKDYIFFELLSVYTDNFIRDKKNKNKRSDSKLARK